MVAAAASTARAAANATATNTATTTALLSWGRSVGGCLCVAPRHRLDPRLPVGRCLCCGGGRKSLPRLARGRAAGEDWRARQTLRAAASPPYGLFGVVRSPELTSAGALRCCLGEFSLQRWRRPPTRDTETAARLGALAHSLSQNCARDDDALSNQRSGGGACLRSTRGLGLEVSMIIIGTRAESAGGRQALRVVGAEAQAQHMDEPFLLPLDQTIGPSSFWNRSTSAMID